MPLEMELSIGGMTCAACAARVEKKLNAIDGVTATVNLATERAIITAPAAVPAQQLIDAVEQAGYRAEMLGAGAGEAGAEPGAAAGTGTDAARVADLRRRLIVALVLFIPLSDLSVLLVAVSLVAVPGLAVGADRGGRAGGRVVCVAVPPGRAAQRPASVGLDGHAGVAGHHRVLRLVGVRDVRAGPRPGAG